jgi:GNAT superfamily N-acetyltransferase
MATHRVEAIARHHDVKNFASARRELNDYLARYARQNHDRGGVRTYVLVATSEPRAILGYYSLVATEVLAERVPDRWRKGLGRYPIPGFRLARLAVAHSHTRRGLGGALCFDAARRCRAAAQIVGARLLIIDATDDAAAYFYMRLGASPLPDAPRTLVLPLDSLPAD